MEAGHNGRELDIRSSSKIEIVVPIAQGKTARLLAQSEESARKVRASANGDDNVLAVSIKLQINIRSRDRILRQRQPRLVLQRHAKQQLWCGRLDCASPRCRRRSTRLLRI